MATTTNEAKLERLCDGLYMTPGRSVEVARTRTDYYGRRLASPQWLITVVVWGRAREACRADTLAEAREWVRNYYAE